METAKDIFYENRWIFILLGVAFIVEIFSIPTPSFRAILPSTLVVVYFLGLSSIIRFVMVRRSLHKVIAGIVDLIMYFGYFMLMAVALGVDGYRPSALFFLCLITAFKILIYEQEKTK